MVATGAWFFHVRKSPPPWAPCEEFLVAAQRAARDEYRVGLKPYAATCAVALLALHLWTNTFAPHATLAVFGALAGDEVVLVLAAYSTIRYAPSRPGFALTWLLAYLWLALAVFIPRCSRCRFRKGTAYFCINGIV